MRTLALLVFAYIFTLLSFQANAQEEAKLGVFRVNGKHHEITGKNPKLLPDSVKARHILISINKGLDACLATCEDLKKQVENGTSFSELAKKHSDDPGSKQKGGNLGWFPQGFMVPEFESAVFSSKKGELSIAQTKFGVHLIEVTAVSKTRTPGEVISYDETKPFTGSYVTKRYADGQKQSEDVYREGMLFQQIQWYLNGFKKHLVTYKNGVPDGPVIKWYESGQMQEKGWQDSNGLQQEYKIWFSNGQLRNNTSFENGKRVGIYQEWWENGVKKEDAYFEGNKIEGERKSWYKTGQMSVQAAFKNGKPNGISNKWFENGNPQVQASYIEGKREGSLVEYYENGQKKFEGAYSNNELHGDYKTWYEDGRIKTEGTAKNGKVINEKSY